MRAIVGWAFFIVAFALSACSQADQSSDAVCGRVACGLFDIAQTKESSPVFLGGSTIASPYRICVQSGSVIVQTIEADGSAQSIGAEIRGGSCADISFTDKLYIIGNTGSGRATGYYYRVP